ncbi:MAG: hypothetical protein AAGB34_08495 [Planctomycetota bacterium]
MSNAGIRAVVVAVIAGAAAATSHAQLTETQTAEFTIDMTQLVEPTLPEISFSRFDPMGGIRQLTGVTANAVHDASLNFLALNYGNELFFDEWFFEISMFMLYRSEGDSPFGSSPAFTLDILGTAIEGADLPAGGIPTDPSDPFSGASQTFIPYLPFQVDVFNTAACDELDFFVGPDTLDGKLFVLSELLDSSPAGSQIFVLPFFMTSGTLSLTYEYRNVDGLRESAFASPTNKLDAFDFFAFLNDLEADDPNAEYEDDAVRDQLDFDAFMSKFFPCGPVSSAS